MLILRLMCFQAKRYLVLGGSQAKAKDVERRQPSSVQGFVIAQCCVDGLQ